VINYFYKEKVTNLVTLLGLLVIFYVFVQCNKARVTSKCKALMRLHMEQTSNVYGRASHWLLTEAVYSNCGVHTANYLLLFHNDER